MRSLAREATFEASGEWSLFLGTFAASVRALDRGRLPSKLCALVGVLLLGIGTSCGEGITGPAPVASVTIIAPSDKLANGDLALWVEDLIPLQAVMLDADGHTLTGREVSWSSADNTVVTVTTLGIVRALKVGSTTISATSEGETATMPVSVTLVPVAGVAVATPAGMFMGDSVQAVATLTDANGRPLTGRAIAWSSSAPTIASISATGIIKAITEGTVTVTATSEGKSGSATLSVQAVPAAQLALTTVPSATVRDRIPFPTQPVVQLQGADGRPSTRAGIVITASVGSGSGTMGGTLTATTSSSGAATFTDLYISGTVGRQRILFVSPGLTGTDTSVNLTAGLPTTVALDSGNNLSTPVGAFVTPSPSVMVTDIDGNAVDGVAVTFTLGSGGGSITAGNQTTNASGIASTGWKLGPNVGSNTLSASVSGLTGSPVTFSGQGCRNCWGSLPPMPTPRSGLAVGVVNGLLYALGGNDASNATVATVEAYDPATNTWSAKASMRTARTRLGAAVVNGVLYAVGGDGGSTIEAYDPATNSWTDKTVIPNGRGYFGVSQVNGAIYVVGGSAGATLTGAVEAYDPLTSSWSTDAPMPTARDGLSAAAVNGILYAIGGYDGSFILYTNALEAYDPALNTWTSKTGMPTQRGALGAVGVNGVLYALGGYFKNVHSEVEAYDPLSDTWTTKAPMPTPRSNLAVGVVNGLVLAIGGYRGGVLATSEVYAP